MVIVEYHSFEDEEHDTRRPDRGYLFDGRWIIKQKHDLTRQPDGSYGFSYLEWTDLFGHQDQKRIIRPSGSGRIVLLSKYLALLKCDASYGDPQRFWGLRLDWKSREIKKGESVLVRSENWNETVIVDRAGPLPNSDICFLLLNTGERRYLINDDGERVRKAFDCAHHCRLDSRDLKIVRDNRPIPLDSDDFNCIDLNGDIISGLSTSLLEIKRYNFRTGKLVDTILVHGLPPTISCLWHKNMHKVHALSRGAWTDSHLFVWSNEGWEFTGTEEEYYDLVDKPDEPEATYVSSVYHVDLKTGVASATALNFKGWIKEFAVGPDGNHLYFRVDEYLRRSSQGDRHYPDYFPPVYKFRYLRVPFNRPESLFFLASIALPRPLSSLALQIIKQNSEIIPIQAFR